MTRAAINTAMFRWSAMLVVLALNRDTASAQGVIQSLYGYAENGLFGSAVASVGDIDGDGASEFVVGVPTLTQAGFVSLYSGATRKLLLTVGGAAPGDNFGSSVSGTGDVDGDGIPDFAVGAPRFASVNPGYVRLISGADGSVLLTIAGSQPYEWFGNAIAGVGDVDGDGRGDLAVGMPMDDRFFQNTGRVRVYSSADGSVLYDFAGFQGGGFLGGAVAAAGDVDGDGVTDLIAGTLAESPNTIAYARVFSLATGAVLHTFVTTQTGDQTGASVAGVGDIDRDGFDDVAVGAYGFDAAVQGAGQVRVYSGADGHLLQVFTGDVQSMQLGTSVAAAGDMDGDGWPDVLAGAPGPPYNSQAGIVRAYSGRTGQILREWTGEMAYSLSGAGFGRAVAALGDVDGDGTDEVLAGAPNTEMLQPNQGLAKVLTYRLPETPLSSIPGPGIPKYFARSVVGGADFDGDSVPDFVVGTPDTGQSDGPQATVTVISGADGSVIRVFTEASSDWSQFGADIDLVGDLDGDGVEEIVIGSTTDASTPIGASGAVFVQSGATGGLLHLLHGAAKNDAFGYSVRRAGDVDADGYEDIIVGIPDDDTVGVDRGSAAVYSGATGHRLLQLFGPTSSYPVNNTSFGEAVSGAGDVDADGHADLLVGDTGDSIAGSGFGRVWVFSGATGNLLYTVPGTHFVDRFGAALGPLGDIDSDGRGDFAAAGIGQANFDVPGRVAAISGATGATIYSTYTDAPAVDFGNHLRTNGDLDRDGVPDIVTGVVDDSTVGPSLGSVRVLSGASGDLIRTMQGPSLGDSYTQFGRTASFLGDLDDDGFDDVVVSMSGYDGVVSDIGAAFIYRGVPPSWFGLGHAKAGTWGTPSLWVVGDLIGGHVNTLTIGGVLAGAPTTLVAGLTQLTAPFKGGTLVPYPLLLLPLVANGSGALTLPFVWPAGAPSGMRIFLQAWSVDAGAVAGLSATNAVRGQVP